MESYTIEYSESSTQGVDLKYLSACRWRAIAAALAFAAHVSAQSTDDAYSRSCAGCHGPELRGGETGPTLIGSAFQQRWGTQPPEELERFIRRTMPPTNPGSLSNADYAATLARIRLANGWSRGTATVAAQKPPSVEWLSNRGDPGSTSYSPLDQINRDNFGQLRIAWRWKSDNFGPTPEFYFRATPLMADGVLYTSAGLRRDVVAIDAATGETLWMYRLDEGARGTSAPRRSSGRGVAFWRSGANLVCIEANTGRRIWHYQIVHHDIWDYDLPAPPVLTDITVAGKKIPAVVQVTKMGLAFVFDRLTGKPVWPIKERKVAQSDVPGEKTSRTQPFPTKPEPFEPQGLERADLIDFTPELKRQALEIVSHYRFGHPYMPPSVVEGGNLGTLLRPSLSGGANWQGAAFDPETGVFYVSSISSVGPIGLRQDPKISDMSYIGAYGEGFPNGSLGGPAGLPLIRPPWGRITAIDMSTGNHLWAIPNTDTPDWASNNPASTGT